jgi:hypothetical protein
MYDIATTVSRVANETYSHTRRIMPEQPWWENLDRISINHHFRSHVLLKNQPLTHVT